MNNKYKRIIFYAYRDDRGPLGGPGGVLYLQNRILGTKFEGIPIKYRFRSKKKLFRQRIKSFYKGAILQIFANELFKSDTYYICNEIGTAFALALLKRDYSLIYHQQGPIVEELTNFGVNFKLLRKPALKIIERIAFKNAKSVHFPSKGAENMYFNSPFRTCNRDEVNVGKVLHNTIDIKKYPAFIEKDPSKLTFLSVGTLTTAKGQDLSLDFMDDLLKKCNKPIRYIVVGVGPLRAQIVNKGSELQNKYPNFEFIYRDRLPHNEIMRLNEISDIYLMMHRISIFDLATLEAMSKSSAVILSDVGGNSDFNVEDNIILVNPNNYTSAIDKFLNSDIEQLKEKNKEVFDKYFSNAAFKNSYLELLENIIK